jgi:hypothetical protein
MTYPAVPLPNQWTNVFVDENDMHNRIDVPLNAMAANMSLWGQTFAQFRARDAVAPAALNVNIDFGTIVEDTSDTWNGGGPGWDTVNKQYVVQKSGLYIMQASWRQASAVAGVLELLTLPAPSAGLVFSGQMGTTALYGQSIDVSARLTAGTVLALRMRGALATPNVGTGSRTYFTVFQIGY